MFIVTNLRKNILIVVLLLLAFSCTDDTDSLPYTYVNIRIDLQDPEFITLNNIGESVLVTGGYNNHGIVVYRLNLDEFRAYDRTCLHDLPALCRTEKKGNTFADMVCECCESEYSLNYGFPTSGPSSRPLKEYRTVFNGEVLTISN